jgi:hypothetical protein
VTEPGGLARLLRDADAIVERAWLAGTAPAAGGTPVGAARPTLVGVGWATVELDRAEAEVSAALGLTRAAWRDARRDALLGASARIARPMRSGPAVVLLEPDTEGRLAATLARAGEGVAVAYVAPPPAPNAATVLSRPAQTPLGTGRLVVAGRAWGPHLVMLEWPDASPGEAAGDRPRGGTIGR